MTQKYIIAGFTVVVFSLNLCGGMFSPPSIDEEKKVIKAPTSNKTEYDSFLRKLGNMYRVYYAPNNNILFQSKPITNDTGAGGLPVDVSKMVVTAVSKIGKPVVYVPYDPNYLINELNTGGAINRSMPKYVISGAITEYDKGIMRQSEGSGFDFFVPFSAGGADGSSSDDDSTTASRIVMDFFLIDYATQTMVSGVQSTKTITIYEQSKSNSVGFHIFGSGFGVNGSVSRKQGIHAALRLLVELSIAEILAKEAGLPYWKLTKDLKADEATIDKVYYDIDGLDNEVKIILLKDYLTKYGFHLDNLEEPMLDAYTIAYFNVLKKDYKLGSLADGYVNTNDLVTLHFNVPYTRDGKKYTNAMAKNIRVPESVSIKTKNEEDPLAHLMSNIDKLSEITSSIYVSSIVDANDMYTTHFTEKLKTQLENYIKQNPNLTLSKKPINLEQKTRSFKKRKKVAPVKHQDLVEVVGYVDTSNGKNEVELQVLSKDAQRLRVLKETLPQLSRNMLDDDKILDAMRQIAGAQTEMKTDDIFFMTDKGDTYQTYYGGEKIEFSLGVREASYAYIFDIDSNLEVTLLFDSTTDTQTKHLTPDELYTIPSEEADFEIIASAPFGKELIKLIVSSVPLKIPEIVQSTRSFKKSAKNSTVSNIEFMNYLRKQASQKNGILYEKSMIIETKAK